MLCDCKKPGGSKGRSVERCCRRAGHGDGVGHDFDKKRRERVVSRILLLMARPGQTTGPLFRPVGEAVEMECMRAFREEWGSCVENGFKDFDKAKKDALWKEWSKRVDENFATAPHGSSSPVSPGYHAPVSTIFTFSSTAMCSSFLPVRFLCSNLLSTPFKMHYTKHHYFPTTFLLLHLLHCGCSITKMEGHVGTCIPLCSPNYVHTPMHTRYCLYII